MSGHEASRLLEAYLDGELDLVRSLDVERHLSECEPCSAALGRQRALRSALTDGSLYYDAPQGLSKRVRTELRKTSKTSGPVAPTVWRWRAVAASLSVAAALAWALVAIPKGPSQDELVSREVVSAHVRSLMAEHLTDVASSDRHTVKPWFNGRIADAPRVVDLADQGFPLVGGRVDVLGRAPVATLVYRHRQHLISLSAVPGGQTIAATPKEIAGYNILSWSENGTVYNAVSDLAAPDLETFAKAFRAASS